MLSETASTALHFVNMLASFGLSVIGTNILCHRYLVEKARVMIKLYGTHTRTPSSTPSASRVSHVPMSFLLYLGTTVVSTMPTIPPVNIWNSWNDPWCGGLYFVALGAPAHAIYKPAGFAIGGLAVLVVIIMVRPRVCSLSIIRS
jgi:hypothetical protein